MVTVAMATASGELHGLVNVIANSVAFDDFKHMTPANKAKCQKEMKEDSRTVKARYINHQGKNERLDKSYCRWPGESIQQWHLIPGYTYELPMGFIKEVNEIRTQKRSGLLTLDGEHVNKDQSPLAKDQEGEKVHELVPASF